MKGEAMKIPTHEHIIEAVRAAARRYPGGVAALAAVMDMAPSSLGNVLNPYADRTAVKLGLEQALFIMREAGDVSALRLMAAEFGYSLLPMGAQPDHDVSVEQLDDVQKLARYQEAIRRREPRSVRLQKLGDFLDDVMETETAVRMEEGQVWRPGCGFVSIREAEKGR